MPDETQTRGHMTTTRENSDTPPDWFRAATTATRGELCRLYDLELPREPGWREGPNLARQSDYAWALEHFGHASELMDPGIIRVVRIFREHGVETCQSCQGGEGHSYRYPSVDILNGPWKALDVANDYGIPVIRIGHLWSIRNGEPEETIWRIEFSPSGLTRLREQWYDQEDHDRAELHAWEQAHAMEAADA